MKRLGRNRMLAHLLPQALRGNAKGKWWPQKRGAGAAKAHRDGTQFRALF
jgi:hypothetical protein